MKNGYFYLEIMISAAHMLGAMLPSEKILKKMCDLVRLGVYFYQILHIFFFNFVRFSIYFNRKLCLFFFKYSFFILVTY